MGGQDCVVRLDNGRRCLRSRVDGKLELGLLSILGSKALEHQSTKTGSSAASKRVEHEESLERVTVVYNIVSSALHVEQAASPTLTSNTTDPIHDSINHLLSDSIVTTGIVVRRILLSTDQHLGVEQLAIVARANLVDGRRIQVDKERPRHMLAAGGFGEEGIVGARIIDILGVGIYATVMAEAVLKTVAMRQQKISYHGSDALINPCATDGGAHEQLPSCVTELNTGLTDVKMNDLYAYHVSDACCRENRMAWLSASGRIVSANPRKWDDIITRQKKKQRKNTRARNNRLTSPLILKRCFDN